MKFRTKRHGRKRLIQPILRIVKIEDQKKSDREDWLNRTPQERLATLTQLREAYNSWKYPGKRFQRVYRVLKRVNKRAAGRHRDLADAEDLEQYRT